MIESIPSIACNVLYIPSTVFSINFGAQNASLWPCNEGAGYSNEGFRNTPKGHYLHTGIITRQIGNLVKKAVKNGWRADRVFFNNHFKNKPGLGRKKTITLNLKQKVINAIICNYYRREKSTKIIACEIGLFILSI